VYYITIGEIIESLQELPKNTEISSFGTGYCNDRQYITVSDIDGNVLKEINLNRRGNDAR
jgi:hypothetical protein